LDKLPFGDEKRGGRSTGNRTRSCRLAQPRGEEKTGRRRDRVTSQREKTNTGCSQEAMLGMVRKTWFGGLLSSTCSNKSASFLWGKKHIKTKGNVITLEERGRF